MIALAWRTVAVALGLVVVRGLAATALGVTGVPAPLGAVMANALLTAFVLVGVAAHLHGGRRERAVPLFLLALGIESSALVEAVLFPLGIPGRELARIWAMDAVVDASVAALAVVLQGGGPSPAAERAAPSGTAWRLAVCVLVYAVAYFAAGTLVWPYVSAFYTALGMPPQGLVVLVQIARGAVYAALVLMLVRRMSATRSVVGLWAGLALSVLGGVAPLLVPNPYMPEAVRMAHLWEVGLSNLIVGAFAGWLLAGGAARPAAVRTEAGHVV